MASNTIVDGITSSRKNSPFAIAAEFSLGVVVPRNVEHRLVEGVCNELEIVDWQIPASDYKVDIPIALMDILGIHPFIDAIAQGKDLHQHLFSCSPDRAGI